MITFETKNNRVILKKYSGTESIVIVPKQIEGKEVQAIGTYAFAENRQLQEIVLPDGLLKIDKHAFYNCRNLEQVSVPGGLESVEDGAFKNCEKLTKFILHHAKPGNVCLKHLLYDQNHTIKVMIEYQFIGMSYLYFPSYEYEYIANEPARIFNEVGYGAGYLYQQCFFNNDVDYIRYDSIFSSAIVSEDMETLLSIALLRLKYPYQLSDLAKERYRNYIINNFTSICMLIFEYDKKEWLLFLEQLGFFREDILPELIEETRKHQFLKGLAWLMDYQRKYFSSKKEEFLL